MSSVLVPLLCEQGYVYLPIHSEPELIDNLRQKLEELNSYTFTGSEWKRFFSECIASANDGIEDKTRRIQEDFVQVLRRDTGESKNISLVDKKIFITTALQVINQYAVGKEDGARYANLYDVTVLVNGLPLVRIELKRRGVAIREAFNQIDRYQRDSFWAGSGLYDYVQIFVISNGTNTKYYSNTTRWNAIKEASSSAAKRKKTRNSFEFTSFWADAKIIITTIQKLSHFVSKNKGHKAFDKHVVIIFDECHRSQFGDMYTAIVKNFKKYHLFGFTGTPIFAVNAGKGGNPQFRTTEQTFGDQLHTYTIVDAINDKNVLPFHVDYYKTMGMNGEMIDEQVWDINREKAYMAPQRIELITRYILEHFDQKTYRGDKTYVFNALTNISEVASAGRSQVEEIKKKQRLSGFNSIFAVASVDLAKLYYAEFKRQMAADLSKKLRVAIICSYGTNDAETDGILDEENPEDASASHTTTKGGKSPEFFCVFH